MQRLYREHETGCFKALRDAIKQVTGEELLTRRGVLKKGCIVYTLFRGWILNRFT